MSNPMVTVGMPVYNGENYLVEAIDALLAQTYGDFELVISDNGSTDATAQICRGYAALDPRVRYYRHVENRGATWNYNFLVGEARGRYFRWAAHDDLCAATHLEQCVAALESMPDVVLVFPGTLLIDEASRPIEQYVNRYAVHAAAPHVRLREFFSGGGLCSPVFGLMRLDTLRQTTMIESYVDSDRTLLGQFALHGPFYEVPEPLFWRRIHAATSVAVNPDRKSRLAWFDPAKKNKVQFPKWRRFGVYAAIIAKLPVSPQEKARCYWELNKRYVGHPKWMFTDIWDNVRPTRRGSDVHARLGVPQGES